MFVTNLRVCVPSFLGYPLVLAAICLGLFLSPWRDYSIWLLKEGHCMLFEAAN